MLNNAFEETVALHSENNTPYKLRPASKDTINSIKSSKYTNDENEKECIVCRDEMEVGCEIIKLPHCHHCFHRPCIVRWLELQSFCPICKAQITSKHDNFDEEKAEDTKVMNKKDYDIEDVIDEIKTSPNGRCVYKCDDNKKNNFDEEKAEDTNNITYQDDDRGI
jgi:hypothetical protein